jgi:replicative DNA helicase
MNSYRDYSEESEQCVIGSLLVNPERFVDVIEQISDEDFYLYSHKVIFRAMSVLDQKKQPIDINTVIQTLSNSSLLQDAGGIGYLAQLANDIAPTRNVMAYVSILKEKTMERKVINLAREMIKEIAEGEAESSERVNNALAMPLALEKNENTTLSTKQILKQTIYELEERYNRKGEITGLRTNYAVLDGRINGLNPGMLWIIGARPSMGKSSLALNLAANFAFNGTNGSTMFFSLEMTASELMGKMVCATGGIDYGNYRKGLLNDDEWGKVNYAVGKIMAVDLVIDDRAGITLQQIRARSIRQKRKTGAIKAIFVDYLTLIRTPNKNSRNDEIGLIAQGLKELAKELECPVIALAQLSRKCEERQDKRPMMSDIRDSGCIEQAADIISFIYRDELYNENTDHKGIAEIITAKNRAGETGKDFLQADLRHSRFKELDYIPQSQPVAKRGF